jgi:hypothetical protein
MAPTNDLLDPATYPLAAALDRKCDLVMKGGITSGVIYPHAVCQLAITHRLQRVGGTSAGAIAAGAAAAAEVGRDAGRKDAGFARLAALPENMAATTSDGHTRLYHLFQPQPGTEALYRLVAVMIGRGGKAGKLARESLAGIRALRPVPALLGVVVPIALLALTIWQGAASGIVAAAVLASLGIVLAVVWSLVQRVGRDLPGNHFGLCTGMGGRSGEPPLTEWLADEFDQMAGRDPAGPPLTFGDLGQHGIELAMFTTDLSAGTQNQLPFRSRIWAFDPTELAQLFPERVVRWMREHPPEPRDSADQEVFSAFHAAGLCPLPLADDVPVIVGVRMSLSFPVLLATVPLHAFDYTLEQPTIVRHRFSDGGITSNFPIHFFDAAIPGQPTFGINLVGTGRLDPDPAKNVSMPDSNRDGILARVTPIETFGGFVAALKNGLQNWSDSMQTRVPGYRDRIVAVKHTKTEGGLNLDMDGDVVRALAERGRYAGVRAEQFDFVNHRWVRLRSFLQTLCELAVPAANTLRAGRPAPDVPTYREMIAGQPPPSYRRSWSPDHGNAVADAIEQLADAFAGEDFVDGAPSPKPQLQVRPRP